MENRKVSQTAMLIDSLRALACCEDDPIIHGNDYLAELFLPDEKRIPLRTIEYRSAIKKAIPEGLYEYVIARTKHFDNLISQHLSQQTPQIVLLGLVMTAWHIDMPIRLWHDISYGIFRYAGKIFCLRS